MSGTQTPGSLKAPRRLGLLLRPFNSRVLFICFLILHTTASFYYISQHNITFDEPSYIEYAKHWLHGHPERVEPLEDSKTPIVAVAWIPRIIRQFINPNYRLHDYGRQDQKEGRYMMILFSLLTALYVYRWCNELYGAKKWILPLLLLLFDPLYLSYSTLVLTDLACGTFLVALLYHFRKYIVLHSRKHFYWAAIFTGLGIVTKQNLVFVLLLLPLLSLVHHFLHKPQRKLIFKKTLMDVLLFVVILILIINVMYYFHKTGMPLGSFVFESKTLQNLQHHLSFLRWLPVPVPESYVQSIDMLKAHAEIGAGKPASTFNGVYLFGELKLTGSIWYYYFVVFFYKMPVGTMLLMAASVPLFLKKFRVSAFADKYQFIVIPVLFFWFILSFVNQFQTGIRHLLLVFPLLYIGLGYLFVQLEKARFYLRALATGAILYTFISVAIYYPYIIPYTNEFVANKATVYRKISDSGINYGQSDSSIHHFLSAHPAFSKASRLPAPGKYIVSMNEICDTYKRSLNPYKWYNQLEPIGHYRYVFALYEVNEEDLQKIDTSLRFPVIR